MGRCLSDDGAETDLIWGIMSVLLTSISINTPMLVKSIAKSYARSVKVSIWGDGPSHSAYYGCSRWQDQVGRTDDAGCDYRGRWHSGRHWVTSFLEALRQMKADVGADNVMYIHTTPCPILRQSRWNEDRRLSILSKELRGLGIA